MDSARRRGAAHLVRKRVVTQCEYAIMSQGAHLSTGSHNFGHRPR
jgi:hypothetical protein